MGLCCDLKVIPKKQKCPEVIKRQIFIKQEKKKFYLFFREIKV